MNTREVASAYRLSQWAIAIREKVSQGESIDEFCERRGVSRNTYFYWQRKLREAAIAEISSAQNEKHIPREFAEIKIAEPLALPGEVQASQLCVEINGLRISVDDTYPPEKLAALLRELSRPC